MYCESSGNQTFAVIYTPTLLGCVQHYGCVQPTVSIDLSFPEARQDLEGQGYNQQFIGSVDR